MNKVINLFEESGAVHPYEEPAKLIERMVDPACSANKAIVVLIDDRAGTWQVNWEATGMNNAEVTLALDIMHRLILDTVLAR